MKICFVLPQMVKKPIGGYKIVYEYANRLSEMGYEVSLLYLNEKALERFHLPGILRKRAIAIFTRNEPKWFKLNKDIKKYSSTEKITWKLLESVNVVVATGADTVKKTYELFYGKRLLYLIQDHETWLYPEDKINEMYRMGFENIVISSWLKKIVDAQSGVPSLLLKNPVDIKMYRVKVDPRKRDKYKVGLLYHQAKHKGVKYALKAIDIVKARIPELKLCMFGTSYPDFEMKEWMEFNYRASQLDTIRIYNDISIFICASISEGYGLTGLEAMACGAALVSTEYDGVREYAKDGFNALLSPIEDSVSLANNIIEIIENDGLRYEIIQNGINSVKDFSWEQALTKLDHFLNNK